MSSTRSSSRSSSPSPEDDVDAITPCPPAPQCVAPTTPQLQTGSTSPSLDHSVEKRRDSIKVLEEGTEGDTEGLWKRMLAVQQLYGCYNSARMSAALESDDVGLLLPSKACLNLLNENMAALPDEAEQGIRRSGFAGWFRRTSRN